MAQQVVSSPCFGQLWQFTHSTPSGLRQPTPLLRCFGLWASSFSPLSVRFCTLFWAENSPLFFGKCYRSLWVAVVFCIIDKTRFTLFSRAYFYGRLMGNAGRSPGFFFTAPPLAHTAFAYFGRNWLFYFSDGLKDSLL